MTAPQTRNNHEHDGVWSSPRSGARREPRVAPQDSSLRAKQNNAHSSPMFVSDERVAHLFRCSPPTTWTNEQPKAPLHRTSSRLPRRTQFFFADVHVLIGWPKPTGNTMTHAFSSSAHQSHADPFSGVVLHADNCHILSHTHTPRRPRFT